MHIPLDELLGRLDKIPPGEVRVRCRSHFWASLAASSLTRAGRSAVATWATSTPTPPTPGSGK